MTGYQSKKAAALDEEGMYLVHHTKGRTFDKFGNKVTNDDDDDDTQVYQQGYAITNAVQPTALTFNGGNSEWVMRITADRRIEVNEDVEVTEAAQKILDALQHLIKPAQRPWVGLTDDEIKEIVGPWGDTPIKGYTRELIDKIEAKLRSKN